MTRIGSTTRRVPGEIDQTWNRRESLSILTSAPSGNWTREKIEELLRSERFDYQAIKLPYGLSTGGHDRSATARQIFPSPLNGESVLDIGSYLGFFCFEARRHGAGRVVGLDFVSNNIRKSQLLAEILGENVEFRLADIENEPIGERFDHVLCLNVLHHLNEPISSLDKLIEATRRRLVLEVATLGRHDRRQLGLNWFTKRALARTPALIVGRGTAAEGVRQFYFTPSGIENLLRYRRGCFSRVELLPSSFKDRFIAIAHKRVIAHLLVFAGPSFSAFEAAFQRVCGGAIPALGSLQKGDWGEPLRAERYHEPAEPVRERLALFYDFDRPLTTGAGNFAHDPALDIVQCAERKSVLTVWNHPDRLLDAVRPGLNSGPRRQRKRLERLHQLYSDTDRLLQMYRQWFAYLRAKGLDHQVLVEETSLLSPEEWEREVAAKLARR
jgi:2-polyprenyl-3-methyl-5-hydroxy-6-metoxy-1,4-benzoquinol methylase